jgi:hypothetical protein
VVESEGKAVLAASREEQLELDWSASQCIAVEPCGQSISRLYVSADGGDGSGDHQGRKA